MKTYQYFTISLKYICICIHLYSQKLQLQKQEIKKKKKDTHKVSNARLQSKRLASSLLRQYSNTAI